MALKQESEFERKDRAARVIQKAWKSFLNVAVFQHFKRLINIRRQGEPRQIVRYINPKEAELLDAAAGINVRFRLGGVKFPPEIYYKIFTHRHIEDLCANSPRDYTKLPAKCTSHIKSNDLQEEDYSGWYRRIENNGWRPVCETFWRPTENVIMGDKKESEFHFSKLKRRQDMEKKRKMRKIEWMQQMYIANWKEIATSNSSANFKSFRFEQAQEKIYDYEDILEEEKETQKDPSFETIYEEPLFTRLKPDSTYRI
ncbi:protein MFI isoform X7 [Cervus canadensis]|uniref:protein MFI isoform X7 n=1 Tax=Cervus canadensis TaxID=1574408 RepID=UPI001C9E4929|nr:protein MFI isoform X7 [Cervus canadensis]